jgi:hypothetical protein
MSISGGLSARAGCEIVRLRIRKTREPGRLELAP